MVANHYGKAGRWWAFHLRDVGFILAHGQVAGEVKIAVIQVTLPVDGDLVSTHDSFKGAEFVLSGLKGYFE